MMLKSSLVLYALACFVYIHAKHIAQKSNGNTEEIKGKLAHHTHKRDETSNSDNLPAWKVLQKREWALENRDYDGQEITGDKPTSKVKYGDIMMTDSEDEEFFGDQKKKKGEKKDAVEDETRLWGLKIPVIVDDSLKDSEAVSVIKEALEEIMKKTCLKFVGRTDEKDYLNFFKGKGCWSWIGKQGGKQEISIGQYCDSKRTVTHEVMHSLGFLHEVQRQDRDDFVKIVWHQLKNKEVRKNFKKMTQNPSIIQQPYDFESVMHYKRNQFGKPLYWGDKNQWYPTVLKKDDEDNYYQAGQPIDGGLSQIDQRQLNEMYCEVERPGNDVIKGNDQFGLSAFIKNKLDEYSKLSIQDFQQMLTEKLPKVFPDQDFSTNVYRSIKDLRESAFICSQCAYQTSQYGKDLLVGYIQKEAVLPNAEEKNLFWKASKIAIESDKLCDAERIASRIFIDGSKNYNVNLVVVTNFDNDLMTSRNADHTLNEFIRCTLNSKEKTFLVSVMFGQ